MKEDEEDGGAEGEGGGDKADCSNTLTHIIISV